MGNKNRIGGYLARALDETLLLYVYDLLLLRTPCFHVLTCLLHDMPNRLCCKPMVADSKTWSVLKVLVFVDSLQIMPVAQGSSLATLRPAEHQVPGGCARFPA